MCSCFHGVYNYLCTSRKIKIGLYLKLIMKQKLLRLFSSNYPIKTESEAALAAVRSEMGCLRHVRHACRGTIHYFYHFLIIRLHAD